MNTKQHPIQPIVTDERGVARFKCNRIVTFLLDNGGIDMNDIARLDVSQEDREQFAQLIGYSVDGYGSLSYASDETYETAVKMKNCGLSEEQAKIEYFQDTLDKVREGIKLVVPELFRIHPDDLTT